MYIRSLRIENFLKIVAFNQSPDGKHVVITGQNGIGKTSIVEAIFEALQGSSTKDRPEPVHKGASKALIVLDLGDYIVEKHIPVEGKPRLVIKAADGSKITSPQKLLDGLLSQYCLDPVAFLDRRPQDQLDDVLRVCGIEPPVAQVEKITNEPSPVKAGESADQYLERLSADEVGEWYRRRREQHRIVETNRGAVEKQEALVATLAAASPDAATARASEVVLAGIDQANELQKSWEAARSTCLDLSKDINAAATKFSELQSQQTSIEKEVVDLESRLCDAKTKLAEVKGRLDKGRQVKLQLDGEMKEAKTTLHRLQDQSSVIASLRQELSNGQKLQKAVIEREQADKRLKELRREHGDSQQHHAKIDLILEELRKLRKAILEGIDLGVDGLEVGQGELLLHGVSFKQASEAQRLRVAVAVAMMGNGSLKLIRIDGGERFDSESRAYLLDMATKNGWQVIMTCVADKAELGVEIIDQEAEVEPTKPEKVGGPKRPAGKLFDDRKTAVQAGM